MLFCTLLSSFNSISLKKKVGIIHRAIFLVLIFLFGHTRHGMWDLSSPTRDQTHALGSGNTGS